MEHRLRGAVERQEFELHYQPKIDVRTRADPRPGSAGALARSGSGPGDAGRVPAADGNQRSHRAAGRLDPAAGGRGPAPLAGRGTRARPRRREHLARCSCAAARSPITCSTWSGEWRNENVGIDIEITEGVLIDDVSSAVSQLRVLRRSGVRVAIDDFGTGYSSLSRLAELPVDMLKIDRSFVSGLTTSGTGRTVAETIIALGKAFDMTTRGRRRGNAGAVRDAGAPGLRPVAGLSAQPAAGRRRHRTHAEATALAARCRKVNAASRESNADRPRRLTAIDNFLGERVDPLTDLHLGATSAPRQIGYELAQTTFPRTPHLAGRSSFSSFCSSSIDVPPAATPRPNTRPRPRKRPTSSRASAPRAACRRWSPSMSAARCRVASRSCSPTSIPR